MNVKLKTALLKLLLFAPFAFGGATNANATSKTWVGGSAGKTNDWNTAANWSPSGVPAATDSSSIPGGLTAYPMLTASAANLVKNVTIDSNASLTIGAGGSLSLSGNIAAAGTLNISGGTLLTPAGNLGLDGKLNMSGGILAIRDLGGAGTVAMSGGTLQINHDFKLPAAQFSATGGSVELAGTADAGAFPTGTYHFFNVTIDAGVNPGFDNQTNSFVIAGNWINNGSASLTGKPTTVTFGGATAQIIGGSSSSTFNNLAINNAAGVTLATGAAVHATLILTSGVFVTGGNQLVLAASGSVSGGSAGSYVNGSLQKVFTAGNGQAFTFPVGDASNYAPVSLAALNVTAGGSLAASSTAGDHPAIGSLGIAPTKSVNRFWTLTNAPGGIVVSSCSATFNYLATDVDAGANGSNFVAGRYNGSWSMATNGVKTTGSMKLAGLASFGDFSVGEPAGQQCLSSCSVRANGSATFKLTGVGGRTYTIQASTDMLTWTNIGTATADANGVCQFDDANAINFPQRFYRAMY
jgi:hypothetical protein